MKIYFIQCWLDSIFRVHESDAKNTYHHSDWGENRASDEKKWWLSVEDTGSDWMIHLFDDQKLTDSYRCLLDDQHSSWEQDH